MCVCWTNKIKFYKNYRYVLLDVILYLRHICNFIITQKIKHALRNFNPLLRNGTHFFFYIILYYDWQPPPELLCIYIFSFFFCISWRWPSWSKYIAMNISTAKFYLQIWQFFFSVQLPDSPINPYRTNVENRVSS